MTERPILFSAEMVRAILQGDKTQTRRVIKPQPWVDDMGNACWKDRNFGQSANHVPHIKALASPIPCSDTKRVLCPYGKPGDLLWVRETCWAESTLDGDGVRYAADHVWRIIENTQLASEDWCRLIQYGGDDALDNQTNIGRRVPSIHMPRWASRIRLRITDVGVERLQDISEDNARAEGVFEPSEPVETYGPKADRVAFHMLWNHIYGAGAWDANPYVWVISFERVKP